MPDFDPIALVDFVVGLVFAVGLAIAFGIAVCRGVLSERRRASGTD